MRCPICGKPVPFADHLMPFCSPRCKLIDLGNWIEERYVISEPLNSGGHAETEDEGRTEPPESD